MVRPPGRVQAAAALAARALGRALLRAGGAGHGRALPLPRAGLRRDALREEEVIFLFVQFSIFEN